MLHHLLKVFIGLLWPDENAVVETEYLNRVREDMDTQMFMREMTEREFEGAGNE